MTDRKQVDLYQQSFLATVERNQIPISRFLLSILYLLHLFYKPLTAITSKFIHLQYPYDPTNSNTTYDIGFEDIYYVINWIISLTFIRSFLMTYVLSPFASKVCKMKSEKSVVRFAEQGWSLFYYSYSFIFGLVLYYHSPYYLNNDALYIGWPHTKLSPSFKRYYLISIAFWIQQIFVLHVEQRRKDYYQMFSHHIITCALIIGSYYYYFVHIGHLILIVMDSVDIILSAAKMLKYAGYKTACDILFVVFLVSWIIVRHGIYNLILVHSIKHAMALVPEGKCIPGVYSKRCWTPTIFNTFFSLLGGLQILTLLWLYLICKVAYKVITGNGAEDVRSDESDEEEEEENEEENEAEEAEEEEAEEIEEIVSQKLD